MEHLQLLRKVRVDAKLFKGHLKNFEIIKVTMSHENILWILKHFVSRNIFQSFYHIDLVQHNNHFAKNQYRDHLLMPDA